MDDYKDLVMYTYTFIFPKDYMRMFLEIILGIIGEDHRLTYGSFSRQNAEGKYFDFDAEEGDKTFKRFFEYCLLVGRDPKYVSFDNTVNPFHVAFRAGIFEAPFYSLVVSIRRLVDYDGGNSSNDIFIEALVKVDKRDWDRLWSLTVLTNTMENLHRIYETSYEAFIHTLRVTHNLLDTP
ncbi:MAG: hypothetical protein D6712_21060 [Chloroflexi bacterium]|nr:MAG: hypothetical protein D6712_21060 [Chloroflexota bacterium]